MNVGQDADVGARAFSGAEILNLCKAWVEVSQDAAVGAGLQKKGRFWGKSVRRSPNSALQLLLAQLLGTGCPLFESPNAGCVCSLIG